MPKKIAAKFFKWMRLYAGSHMIVYDGFGNEKNCSINGHTLMLSPLPRKKQKDSFFFNTLALIRMFMVQPKSFARVKMVWDGKEYFTKSEKDGYFRFDWPLDNALDPGDYEVQFYLLRSRSDNISHYSKGIVRIPERSHYFFISDIDDTFLISHSETKLKRMWVLLTENAHSRRPFDGVVRHYQMLQYACTTKDDPNPFFYVSSSEWNLYRYIKDFIQKNELPRGVFLLNQLKTFSELLKTGQNNHSSKFMRIVRIIEAYPNRKFILLGDNSQQDPHIYKAITDHFAEKIKAVYIRDISKKPKPDAESDLEIIRQKNIPVCYFKHSEEAMKHSLEIGLEPASA